MYIFIIILLFISPFRVRANEIVATIQDKSIITSDELEQNILISVLLKDPKMINNKEILHHIKVQVLAELINEKICILHAQKNNLNLENIDISSEIEHITKSLGIKKNLYDYIGQYGIRKDYFDNKIKAQIVRGQILHSVMDKKQMNITIGEIELKLKELKQPATIENKQRIYQILVGQKMQLAESEILASLRKMYYVEIL